MTRRDKISKPKRECCEKPLRKACKRCPRRLGAGSGTGRPGGLPPCVAELLRR
ncbi:MAG TPA: hypothetical protein VMT18_03495 [Planctomycetota bacterium]|nr:hypothetical protein [Planctomycetota bacterium]